MMFLSDPSSPLRWSASHGRGRPGYSVDISVHADANSAAQSSTQQEALHVSDAPGPGRGTSDAGLRFPGRPLVVQVRSRQKGKGKGKSPRARAFSLSYGTGFRPIFLGSVFLTSVTCHNFKRDSTAERLGRTPRQACLSPNPSSAAYEL